MKNTSLTKNLTVFQEGDTLFVQPDAHAAAWQDNHSYEVKRAGSVLVIKGDSVEKNILVPGKGKR